MYYFLLIESRPAVAHVVHRANLIPFLYSVLACIHLWETEEMTASEVQRTDIATEQRRTLFSTTAFDVVIRNAAITLGWSECSHCYLPLFLYSTLYIFSIKNGITLRNVSERHILLFYILHRRCVIRCHRWGHSPTLLACLVVLPSFFLFVGELYDISVIVTVWQWVGLFSKGFRYALELFVILWYYILARTVEEEYMLWCL